jgi:hypothetical protein
MRSIRVLMVVFAIAFAAGPWPALGQLGKYEDIDAAYDAADATGPVASQMFVTMARLRGLAVIILLLAGIVAALAITIWGNSKLAFFVIFAGIVLFGGFWIYALLADPFSNGEQAQLFKIPYQPATYSGPQLIFAPVIEKVAAWLLTLLGTAIVPFLALYGVWLGVAIAYDERYRTNIFAYIVGSSICLTGSAIGQVFLAFTASAV